MTYETYRKLDIAREQLETALRLYFDEKEFFSVITLAGAAEEILGAHLRILGDETALESLTNGGVRIHRAMFGTDTTPTRIRNVANRAKNSSKHMNGSDDSTLRCHPKREARDLLERAVDNYYALIMKFEALEETPLIRRFHLHRVDRDV